MGVRGAWGDDKKGAHFSVMRALSCRQKQPPWERQGGAKKWNWRSVQ